MREDIKYRIVQLIKLYITDDLSVDETRELEEWLDQDPSHRSFFNEICQGAGWDKRQKVFRQINKMRALACFGRRIGYRKKLTVMRVWRYAAILLVPLTLTFLMVRSSQEKDSQAIELIQPGTFKATLTLADGKDIFLQQETYRELNEAIVVPSEKDINAEIPRYNSLKTPKGGEIEVILSDGSKIHLNAASELNYPVVFDNKTREVFVRGEAYFEIAKDTDRPFYVNANGVRIKVYGTSFNVNTHFENKVQTVLVSGSIGITGKETGTEIIMTPGYLSEFTGEGELLKLQEVNIDPYIAWQKGELMFEKETLEYIMHKLSLWYDVDVFFMDPELEKHRFTGHMKKYNSIENILDAISRIVGLTYEIEDRTIILMKP